MPKSVFKLSGYKDVYTFAYKDMMPFLESFFQSKAISYVFCKRCCAFNCEINDLVFRVTCKARPNSRSVIVNYERISGCPLIFAELYRDFRSALGDFSSSPTALSRFMELKDVPIISQTEAAAAVTALKFWILCDPVEASEAIEAYQNVLDPVLFHSLREEAIASCRRLAGDTPRRSDSPEKSPACCCCWDANDGSSDYDESRFSLTSLNVSDATSECNPRFHI